MYILKLIDVVVSVFVFHLNKKEKKKEEKRKGKTIKININKHCCFLINCCVKINKVMMFMYFSFPDINTLYYLKLLLTGFFLGLNVKN